MIKKLIIISTIWILAIGYIIMFCGEENSWYVEITNEYINLRKETNTYGNTYGKVYKGETYKAIDIKEDNTYIWYKIEYKNKEYWVANPRSTAYLKDYNNPNDIVAPTLKFYENTYKTYSIDTIKYDHLEITDDKNDYTITHKVYVSKDNLYWIKYTVTDAAGHSTTKTQQIVFEVNPDNVEEL